MQNLLKKNLLFIISLILMIVYVIIAPSVFYDFFIKQGKPELLSSNLSYPEIKNGVYLNVEKLEKFRNNEEELYNLSGWAFLKMGSNPNGFVLDKVVLKMDDSHFYYYKIDVLNRPDVEEYFKNEIQDIKFSGFSIIISKTALKLGKYQIILLFKNKIDNLEFSYVTNNIIIRTPNQISMDIEKPNPVSDQSFIAHTKTPTIVISSPKFYNNKQIFENMSNDLIFSIDGIKKIDDTSNNFLVWGWSLPGEKEKYSSPIDYERQILLISDNEILSFPSNNILRKDVVQMFAGKRNDMKNDGYNIFIASDSLKQEKYQLGIYLKNPITNKEYFVKTNKLILRIGKNLIMKDNI